MAGVAVGSLGIAQELPGRDHGAVALEEVLDLELTLATAVEVQLKDPPVNNATEAEEAHKRWVEAPEKLVQFQPVALRI